MGALTRPGALSGTCAYFEGGRLAAEGYNTTSIKNIICQADKVFSPNDMPSIEQIRQNTIQYSSWIWIYQAIGALQNDKNKLLELCLSINVGNSYLIGQNGKLAKSVICSVANGAPLPTVPQPIFGKESGRTMAVRSRDNTWPAAYVKLSDSRSKATTTILQGFLQTRHFRKLSWMCSLLAQSIGGIPNKS